MALNAYLNLTGAKQGKFNGGVTMKGRTGSIAVFAMHNEVKVPQDAHSGLATGKREHQPLFIYKDVDPSSIQFWTALTQNEVISTWTLQFWRPSAMTAGQTAGTGATENQFYTIALTNAVCCSMEMIMDNNKVPETSKFAEYEKIGFVYQQITWTWTQGGLTAVDNWEAPLG